MVRSEVARIDDDDVPSVRAVMSNDDLKPLKVDSPSGLFLARMGERFFGYDFVPFDVNVSTSIQSFTEADKNLLIIQSCNGLLLCYMWTTDEFYVYNPCLKMFKVLPDSIKLSFDPYSDIGGVKMAFDPTKLPHYKIIQAVWIEEEDGNDEIRCSIQIEI
ncbi:hypothetical protein Tco_0400012 [Tanacetum coccineum]